jgi:hypothetical protein
MTLQNAPPGLDYERDKRFSKVYSVYRFHFIEYIESILIYISCL